MALFGQSTKSKSQLTPYGPAHGGLDTSIGRLADFAWPQFYPESTVSPTNPWQTGGAGRLADFSEQWGRALAGNMTDAARQGLSGLPQAVNMYANPAQFQFDQGTFNQAMGNLMPALQGTYQDATRDIMRDLNFSQLPGLDLSIAGAGGFGSSRGELGRAMTQGMAMDRAGDIGSQLYQNAVNQAFGAGMTGGLQNLSSYYQGAGGLTDLGTLGGQFNQSAFAQAGQLPGMMMQAGDYRRGLDQSILNDAVNRWNWQQQAPWQYEQQRLNALMGPAAQFGTQRSKQSTEQGIGNILAGLAGTALMGGMNPMGMFGGMGGGAAMAAPMMGGMGYGANILNPMMTTANWGGLPTIGLGS